MHPALHHAHEQLLFKLGPKQVLYHNPYSGHCGQWKTLHIRIHLITSMTSPIILQTSTFFDVSYLEGLQLLLVEPSHTVEKPSVWSLFQNNDSSILEFSENLCVPINFFGLDASSCVLHDNSVFFKQLHGFICSHTFDYSCIFLFVTDMPLSPDILTTSTF